MTFEPNSTVLVGWRLAGVVRARRESGIDGYDLLTPPVDPGDLTLMSRWVPTTSIAAPVIGGNVCDRAATTCWCGLLHLSAGRLAELRAELASEVSP